MTHKKKFFIKYWSQWLILKGFSVQRREEYKHSRYGGRSKKKLFNRSYNKGGPQPYLLIFVKFLSR